MSEFASPAIKRLRSTASFDESAGKTDNNEQASAAEATLVVSSFPDVYNQFGHLNYFLELVRDNAIGLIEVDKCFECWQEIYSKGRDRDCDWSILPWERLQSLWFACVYQSQWLNLTAFSATSMCVRSGMKRETYDDIYRFLRNEEYPANIANNSVKLCQFRNKCAKYSMNSDGQIEYRGKGAKKIVLLEGEVQPVVRYVHSALGHASYQTVGLAVSSHFHTSCSLEELAKVLIGGCDADCERLATRLNYKSVRIMFQRTVSDLHIEVILDNETLSQSYLKCVFTSSENIARVGMPVSIYQRTCVSSNTLDNLNNDRKGYKFDEQMGLLTRSGKLVLDDGIGVDVIFQLHNKYGHITYKHLKDLVSLHFYCPGIARFSGGIRSFCTFCSLKSRNRQDATPSEVYRNADYDVLVEWKDGERKISIRPIGLNQTLVECYVEKILKKKNVTMEQITKQQNPEKTNSKIFLQILKKVGKIKDEEEVEPAEDDVEEKEPTSSISRKSSRGSEGKVDSPENAQRKTPSKAMLDIEDDEGSSVSSDVVEPEEVNAAAVEQKSAPSEEVHAANPESPKKPVTPRQD